MKAWPAWALLLLLGVAVFLWRDGQERERDAALVEHARRDSVATARYVAERDSALAVARSADSVAASYRARRARVVVVRDTTVRVDTLRDSDTVVVAPRVADLLDAADSVIAADSAAIHALRASLVRADTALAVRGARVAALETALRAERRRVPWKAVALAAVGGYAVGRLR